MSTPSRASQTGLNAAIAATLNGERVALGLSFDELAERSGISVRSLKRYLSSMDRDITVPILDDLAEALDLPVREIVRRAQGRLSRPPREHPSTDVG